MIGSEAEQHGITTVAWAAARRVGVLSLVVLAACRRGSAEEADGAKPVTVTVGPASIAVAKTDNIQTGPAISGSLTPEREAQIRAQIGGSVLQVHADQGQSVRAGTLLARIDDAAIRDLVLSARSGIRSAESANDVASRELQRSERLLAAGAVAERDVEAARRTSVSSEAALADARARLAGVVEQQSNTQVRAPFTGVVSQRAVKLYTVVAPGSMRLEASVSAEQLGQVRVGMPVHFRVSGYGDREFEGRITRVNPVADPATRQVRIVASIPNSGSSLVGGLFAEGRVASETRQGIVLPLTAVNETGLAPSVIRVKGGRADRVAVELGIRDASAETVEVRSGLVSGDTVLVGAATGTTPGTLVRIGDIVDQGGGAQVAAPAAGRAQPATPTKQ